MNDDRAARRQRLAAPSGWAPGAWARRPRAARRGGRGPAAIELGYRLIDTAEMYGEGGAETVVGAALGEACVPATSRAKSLHRQQGLPAQRQPRPACMQACERSLGAWAWTASTSTCCTGAGRTPLVDTVAGFEALQRRRPHPALGCQQLRHRRHGRADGRTAAATPARPTRCYYSLSERGAEFDLLPWLQRHRMPLMAYCPIDQGRLVQDPVLQQLAQARGATRRPGGAGLGDAAAGVMAIPKAVREAHLRREPRARSRCSSTPRTCRRWTGGSHRPSAARRWR